MGTLLRISQPRLGRSFRDGAHPETPSDGLTLDTPDGPVDLVAVQRVQLGQPTPVTQADIRYVTGLLPDGHLEHTEPIARGLGITPAAVQRAHERHKANQRQDPDTP